MIPITLNYELYLCLCYLMIFMGIFTFISTLFVKAPYGRHQKNKNNNNDKIKNNQLKNEFFLQKIVYSIQGPLIPSHIAWLFMESPSIFIPIILFILIKFNFFIVQNGINNNVLLNTLTTFSSSLSSSSTNLSLLSEAISSLSSSSSTNTISTPTNDTDSLNTILLLLQPKNLNYNNLIIFNNIKNIILIFLFFFHYFHRSFIFSYFISYQKNNFLSFLVFILAFLFCSLNGLLQSFLLVFISSPFISIQKILLLLTSSSSSSLSLSSLTSNSINNISSIIKDSLILFSYKECLNIIINSFSLLYTSFINFIISLSSLSISDILNSFSPPNTTSLIPSSIISSFTIFYSSLSSFLLTSTLLISSYLTYISSFFPSFLFSPLSSSLSSSTINTFSSYSFLSSLLHLFTPIEFFGIILFFVGFASNLYHDYYLMSLKKQAKGGYLIPTSGLFKYVSSANYCKSSF